PRDTERTTLLDAAEDPVRRSAPAARFHAPARAREPPQRGELSRQLAERVGRAVPRIRVSRDDRQRAALTRAADVDRRMRTLQRTREARGAVEPVPASCKARRILAEEELQHLERLVELLRTNTVDRVVEPELCVLGWVRAAAEPEVESPTARL